MARKLQTLSRDSVAMRAYQIFEARGKEPGGDVDDWLQAERELTAPKPRQSRPRQTRS